MDSICLPCRSLFALCAFLIVCCPTQATASDSDLLENNIPVVLTPTRLRQSLADVPASVTVITAEMLHRYGITSIPDALRLVPGMAVTQVTGNDYRINYHGTNILVPRRMNVLIDGMSVYRPALARVDWKELPVAIDDVDRIEVTRGPNSASYGANSMLAIVNIITKHPKEAEGTTLMGMAGSLQTVEGMARYGGKLSESTSYRLTLDRQHDSGFDYSSRLGKDHDSTLLDKLNFRSITEIASNETVDFQAAVVQGVKQLEFVDKYQQTFPDIATSDYYLNALWRKSLSPNHDVQLQATIANHRNAQDWTTCPPTAMFLPQMFALWRANPAYANAILAGHIPSGGSAQDNALAAAALAAIGALGPRAAQPTCVDANQNYVERRSDVEYQDTFVYSDALRMVSGFGVRQDMGDSQTFAGGRVHNNSERIFANVEYKPIPWLNVNAGGFLEKDQITGTAFSPRVALNTHLTENHTLRFVVSKGVRMPDLQEQRGNWSYLATNFNPPLNGVTQGYFFQSAIAPGNLSSEKILSKEIGYLGNLPQYGLLIDAKIFDDRLTDLISEKLQVADFSPTNTNSAHLRGTEWQINYEPSDRWMFNLAYAYLHNDATTPLEQTQYANHSGALGLTRVFERGWRGSLAFYGSGANSFGQSFYGRQDMTFSKTFALEKDTRMTTSFIVRHLDNPSTLYFLDFGKTAESRYNSSMQYFVTCKYSF
jgi:iron complex outermembrane receptor protein